MTLTFDPGNQALTVGTMLLTQGKDADAAETVIRSIRDALKNGKPVPQPNLPMFIATILGNVPENVDYKTVISQLLDTVQALHDDVERRLRNPQTEAEKFVAGRSRDAGYWAEPFKRPDAQQLLDDLGLGGRRIITIPGLGAGDLGEAFSAEVPAAKSSLLVELEKKDPRQVLSEMDELVGLDDLKRDAKRLIFRQSYDKARAAEQIPPTAMHSLNTAIMGSEGTGKSSFARKQADLLYALGLSGPAYVEVTNENLAQVGGSMGPPELARLFAKADTIVIELPPAPREEGAPNFVRVFLAALQMSLTGREKPPVVILTGTRNEVEHALEANPGVRPLIANFVTVEEPTPALLGTALDRSLKKAGLEIEDAGRDAILYEFGEARKRFGTKGFRNMREVNAIVERLPDVIAERLFGSEENEQGLMTAPDKQSVLKTVTLADVQALNLRRVLGGPSLTKSPGIGFTANL
jgi:hypothetical protein